MTYQIKVKKKVEQDEKADFMAIDLRKRLNLMCLTGRIITKAAIEQNKDTDKVCSDTFTFFTTKSFHQLTV